MERGLFVNHECELGTPPTDIELDVVVRKIFKIVDTYYDEHDAEQIEMLIREYVGKKRI